MSRADPATGTTSFRPDGRSLGFVAAAGLLTYLVGYALTYAAVGQEVSNSLAARVLEVATGDPGTWQLVGDTFSSALYVLPPAVLLVGSAAVAVLGRVERPVAGAIGGVAVTIGYLPLAAIGAVLVGIDIGDATAGPPVAAAVLLAGFVYPLVFGAVGGAVGAAAGGRR